MSSNQRRVVAEQRRIVAAWMQYYTPLMQRPVRGIITYGGGLNILHWIDEAKAQGWTCNLTPEGVTLR